MIFGIPAGIWKVTVSSEYVPNEPLFWACRWRENEIRENKWNELRTEQSRWMRIFGFYAWVL